MRERVPIKFGTDNIRNGCNRELESEIRVMSQTKMDLRIFQETKVTDGIYTHELTGYIVVVTDTPMQNCGRVAVFYRPTPHFAVEAVHKLRTNVVSL